MGVRWYRIVEQTHENGGHWYVPQRRILGMWWNFREGYAEIVVMRRKHEDAVRWLNDYIEHRRAWTVQSRRIVNTRQA